MKKTDIAILKTIWRRENNNKWAIDDLQTIQLEPREGFNNDYYKVKNNPQLMIGTPGKSFNNSFSLFGDTEFLLRQSIVPVVAWRNGGDEIKCIGTGFFVSASGLLITAAHVIRDPLDEKYGDVTEVNENKKVLDDQLNFGILLPVNPAIRNPRFDVHPKMRDAKTFFCPFEWIVHWGKSVESPLFHREPEFRIDVDIAICKVLESELVGPFQPLNIGLQKAKVGDRAVAIGYAEMTNIPMVARGSQPELFVSVGSVTNVYPNNHIERNNPTPGPNFEFDAKIPGKMSGSPILVGAGILTKGVVSRSWHGERNATGCMVSTVMGTPLNDGKSLFDLMAAGAEGITQIKGPDL